MNINKRIGNSSLSEAAVRELKKDLAAGFSIRFIAAKYDIGTEQVRRINRGEAWGWVSIEDTAPTTIQPSEDEISASLAKLLKGDENA